MPGCARRHVLGGPDRGRNIPPHVPAGPGGRWQLLAPPSGSLLFRRALLAGGARMLAQPGPVNQASCMVMGGSATPLNSAELRPARRPSPAGPGQSWRTMPGDSSSLRALCPPGLGSRPAKAFVPNPK
ncbi:hypothetical protein P7K49_003467 [Saguinus oedipus]|uniref:Uncharacterized protein n=1 Tax=Saguinus oedipus TaxID=9490 RepID=A0ABQ9W4L5_SAGOE|nr:hypothetical protein P7K49_003467 [Saguinus oedipus]